MMHESYISTSLLKAMMAIIVAAEEHRNADMQIQITFNEKKEDTDLHKQLEELHAKLSEAKDHKDELDHEEDTKEVETKEDSTEDLQELIGELSEQLETMKAHLYEIDHLSDSNDQECTDDTEYNEYSILDDKIDEIQSTVTDIHETVNAIMEGIPHSFDKLTMDIMENEGSAKIKKKHAAKIIAAIDDIKGMIETGYGCILSRINNVENCTKTISETKDIALENQKRISNLINSLNAAIKIYDSSEDQKTGAANVINDILLCSKDTQRFLNDFTKDTQHFLNDIYTRQDKIERGIDKILDAIYRVSVDQHDGQDAIEKKLDADDKNIINEVLTVRDYLRDAETCILYRQNKLEEKLDAILKAINKPAKKSSTTKKSTTTKPDKSTK